MNDQFCLFTTKFNSCSFSSSMEQVVVNEFAIFKDCAVSFFG